jgi:hypothetical protein
MDETRKKPRTQLEADRMIQEELRKSKKKGNEENVPGVGSSSGGIVGRTTEYDSEETQSGASKTEKDPSAA